jgi:hypothetical protein
MIHYVCVATENKLYLPYLKQLIPDLVILGMGIKWKGFVMKIELMIDYLKTLNENDIVCVIDAYDLLPTKNIIHLEDRFNEFMKKNPNVKMVIGCDKSNNILFNMVCSMLFDNINGNSRLNGGQYIGYVKNISYILNSFNLTTLKDDQVELTTYANNNPDFIYIDNVKHFFNVQANPLIQAKNNYDSCFLHANANGQLEDFLLEEHNIIVPLNIKTQNYIINIEGLCKKFKLYLGYIIDNLSKQINFTPQYQENSNHPLIPPQTSCKSQD